MEEGNVPTPLPDKAPPEQPETEQLHRRKSRKACRPPRQATVTDLDLSISSDRVVIGSTREPRRMQGIRGCTGARLRCGPAGIGAPRSGWARRHAIRRPRASSGHIRTRRGDQWTGLTHNWQERRCRSRLGCEKLVDELPKARGRWCKSGKDAV